LKTKKNDLLTHWLVVGLMLLSLLAYLVICYQFGHELQEPLPETERVLIRTIFYAIAIATLPITNLIRHIQLRLNQTMPGNKPAKARYLLTIIVSMALVESIGVLGFAMFMLGDDFNSLNIFLGLSVLGLYLYRPKQAEYSRIVDALAKLKEPL
jgi:hypothetical protein